MQPDDVLCCIEQYKECSARCAFLEREINDLEIDLERLKRSQLEDGISITQKWNGMPHGSGTGDPTGQLAQKIADGVKPEYILDLEREIEKKREEYRKKSSMVVYVDSWLRCLSERERYVITAQCIRGAYWRDVVTGYRDKFGETYSPQGLKKIRMRALHKIYEIAK